MLFLRNFRDGRREIRNFGSDAKMILDETENLNLGYDHGSQPGS